MTEATEALKIVHVVGPPETKRDDMIDVIGGSPATLADVTVTGQGQLPDLPPAPAVGGGAIGQATRRASRNDRARRSVFPETATCCAHASARFPAVVVITIPRASA